MGILELIIKDERVKSLQIGKTDGDEKTFELLIVFRGIAGRLIWFKNTYSESMIYSEDNHDKIIKLIFREMEISEQVLMKGETKDVN